MSRCLLVALIALTACTDTGRNFVSVPFFARGTGVTSASVSGWDVTLTRADVAVGPIYFCATALASRDFCEDALLENLETQVVSGLDATERSLGNLDGVSGAIRSATYDYGYSYLLTHQQAEPNDGAVEGHSAVLEGTAVRGPDTLRFRLEVDVVPSLPGANAVQGAKTTQTITASNVELTVVVDPVAWLAVIDFDAVFALPHDPDAVVIVGRGVVGHDAVVSGMTSLAPPTFEWRAAGD